MMVQIIENWSEVTGRVTAIKSAGEPGGHRLIDLHLETAAEVEAFPNLLADAVGQDIELALPEAGLAGIELAIGTRLRCRVRKATLHKHFAHPHHIAAIP